MKHLRILSVYNRYLNRGGEDEVFESEASLLEQNGCEVMRLTEQVRDPNDMKISEKAILALNTIWSRKWFLAIQNLLRRERPSVVHIHNWFPLFSPAIYYAAQRTGTPVVQTLHNYRLLCPNSLFYCNGGICEDCLVSGSPLPGVFKGCYRESYAQTMVLASMLTIHRLLRTWDRKVDVYIALTHFGRNKFIEGGIPKEKIVVKPNFVYPDPKMLETKGDYALFLGRLSVEKGVKTLLDAWKKIPDFPLKVVGDGIYRSELHEMAQRGDLSNVELVGLLPHAEGMQRLQDARFLIMPSVWYEPFGLSIIEAFACGKPVVASRLGGMPEIIEDGKTGLLFEPGNPDDLAAKVRWLIDHEDAAAQMGKAARAEFEAKYTAEKNYEMLMDIYEMAIKIHGERNGRRS